jgi:hypothetical protein
VDEANIWADLGGVNGGMTVIYQENRLLATCFAVFTTMSWLRQYLTQVHLPLALPVFTMRRFAARIDVISCMSAPCSSAGHA